MTESPGTVSVRDVQIMGLYSADRASSLSTNTGLGKDIGFASIETGLGATGKTSSSKEWNR